MSLLFISKIYNILALLLSIITFQEKFLRIPLRLTLRSREKNNSLDSIDQLIQIFTTLSRKRVHKRRFIIFHIKNLQFDSSLYYYQLLHFKKNFHAFLSD